MIRTIKDAGATAELASIQSDGVSHVPGTLTVLPDTLIRTMDGQIIFWSPDPEQRYGFTCWEALGRTSHQLRRTVFPLKLPEMEATVGFQQTSSGMLNHRHDDGRAVITVNQ